MNDLIRRLMDKTGLPEDTARAAVDIVVAYFKENVPTPIAARLDWVMKGEAMPAQSSGSVDPVRRGWPGA